VPFRVDAAASPAPFAPSAATIVFEPAGEKELHIKYGGELSEAIAGTNMISPDLVELELYSAWFPLFPGLRECTFEAEADLPAAFPTTTNGRLLSESERNGRRITKWRSFQPGMDIVLLASPKLHRVEGGPANTKLEMNYYLLPEKCMQAKIDGLVAGMDKLSALYGAPRMSGALRFVYSPRGGFGYSRMPLIVVSEERAKGVLAGANGEANDFRDNAHEMAHFWWTIADPGTPNDWINEGLAEFTAFRLTEQLFGKAFADAKLAEYRRNAGQSKTNASIAETSGDSPDREANRYSKAPLMLLEAQRRFGAEPLDRLLKAVYARHAGTLNATTADFLAEARAQMGPDAEAYFRTELFRNAIPGGVKDEMGKGL